MKKSTVSLLVSVMIFAFVGLLYLQVNYLREIVANQDEQFRDAVKRSLSQVSRSLEMEEASRLLSDQIFISNQRQSQSAMRDSDRLTPDTDEDAIRDFTVHINAAHSPGRSSLNFQSQMIQESLLGRYYYSENLLSEVFNQTVRQIMRADEKPIDERINFVQLRTYIEMALAENNLELPFHYAVIDNNRNAIYRSMGYGAAEPDGTFSQVLFPRDPSSRLFTLQVVFPTRSQFLLHAVKFIIPSIVFSILLLAIFTVTLYIILRQKHLSEIKKDFINNMTHELKTPVSSISIAGQMLSDNSLIATLEHSGSLSKSATFNKITRTISNETKRLQFLIDKVLQISLMEDRRSILKIKELDANDLLLHVAHLFDLQVVKCGGALELELEALESTVYADEIHFTNVLFNLMENAVKYRRSDVPLQLTARTENVDDRICISIHDNGAGIKKEHLKKIFDRFYRVNTGNIHNVKGFGLGLAYVKKIVEELNGTIKVESELNSGTTFIISLPYVR
jgi:signal transduction histidine kinase